MDLEAKGTAKCPSTQPFTHSFLTRCPASGETLMRETLSKAQLTSGRGPAHPTLKDGSWSLLCHTRYHLLHSVIRFFAQAEALGLNHLSWHKMEENLEP